LCLSGGYAAYGYSRLLHAEQPVGLYGLPVTCVHPASRRSSNKPIVVVESELHDSTGSTVNTFLPQDDINNVYEVTPMATIEEQDDSNDDDDDDDDH
jgi:Uncharacterised protein UPF0515